MRDLQRPIYLNLFAFSFPITAIVSILHRLTGLLLFILIPVFLCMLQSALFYMYVLASFGLSLLVWAALTAVIYHLFAGIRHLCMDLGFAESKKAARVTSFIVLIVTGFGSILIWLRL